MSIWRWKNIYEKHLYDKIPLECEARQCYDADSDDSLSPFNIQWQMVGWSIFLGINNHAFAFSLTRLFLWLCVYFLV